MNVAKQIGNLVLLSNLYYLISGMVLTSHHNSQLQQCFMECELAFVCCVYSQIKDEKDSTGPGENFWFMFGAQQFLHFIF